MHSMFINFLVEFKQFLFEIESANVGQDLDLHRRFAKRFVEPGFVHHLGIHLVKKFTISNWAVLLSEQLDNLERLGVDKFNCWVLKIDVAEFGFFLQLLDRPSFVR